MSSADCLPEPALWPAAGGETLSPEIASHLRRCAACCARVDELREQRAQLLAAAGSVGNAGRSGLQAGRRGSATATDSTAELARCVATAMHDSQSPPVPDRPCPAQIGAYEIVRLLKVGGQAEVYLARHPALDVEVVVKWAHQKWSRCPELTDRFTDEARLLYGLQHPQLVRVYDLGIADGRPYLVLEYVAGCELSHYGAQPLPARQAALLVAGIARTLHAVHLSGRLHLDLQPDNILIDENGQPRLIDFGASVLRGGGSMPILRDVNCGTPEYMAPEQLSGQTARLDVGADVYALGAILHELATGAPPQPEVLWENLPNLESEVCRAKSPPAALLRICRRALDPDPARRQRTAKQLAVELESFAAWRSRTIRVLLAALAVLWSVVGLNVVRSRADRIDLPGFSALDAAVPRPSHIPLADSLTRLLKRAADEQRTAVLVLADGRTLPLNMQQPAGEVMSETADPPAALTAELLGLQGVNLLVVLTGDGRPGVAWESGMPTPLRLRLPTIPPDSYVLLNPQSANIVAGETRRTLLRVGDDRLIARWRDIQARLSGLTPDYEALAFRTAAGSNCRETQLNAPIGDGSSSPWSH